MSETGRGIRLFRRYTYCLLMVWTVLISGSLLWNYYQTRQDTIEKARIEARTIFEHNLAYRKWNTRHGGVYAPVSVYNRPNEYLVVGNRDLMTVDGQRLTMINPFRMTKQVYSILQEQTPLSTLNRTVSLHPLNSENEPDAWERSSLGAFERGVDEVSEITNIQGEPYMRLLKPYLTTEGCLHCHGFQGYKVGDIRGGMSIAVPMDPYFRAEQKTRFTVGMTHVIIWFIGMAGIVLLSRTIDQKQRTIVESEWKFRTLSEFAYDWEYWISERSEIVFMSPSCLRITGYGPEEFLADPDLLDTIVFEDDRQKWEYHGSDFRSPQHEAFEFRITAKDGRVRWISHECGPVVVDHVFMGRRVSNRDITDRKELQAQLEASRRLESIGMLAGGVAHDFNNLLSVILGYTGLAEQELRARPEKAETYLAYVLQASEKARDLTTGLLAFSRRQAIEPSVVSLNSIVSSFAGLLGRLVAGRVRIDLRLAESELPVLADPNKIEQVLMNLVTNARDAMPNGGTISVTTGVRDITDAHADRHGRTGGSYMILTVSDTGGGMDEETRRRIFEPFFTTKESGKGTGLGLATVYGIVTQHKGFVEVTSASGHGTSFEVFLPAVGSGATEKTSS